MFRLRGLLIANAVLAAGLCGCNKQHQEPPLAQQTGNNSVSTRTSADDAGAAVTDAGVAPLPSAECKNIEPALFSGEDPTTMHFANAVDEPSDLSVTRVVGTWEDNCAHPTIRIALSHGHCPMGDGHELRFLLDAASIDNGQLKMGEYEILPEDEDAKIRVRYFRPNFLDPTGEWGNCGIAPGGAISFRSDPRTTQFAYIEAQFQAQLSACDASDNPLEQLTGSFYVQLRRSESQACPSM